MRKVRKTKSSRSKLIEKLDAVFSQYIRIKACQPFTGMVECFTSGRMYHWTQIQNGHYMSRRYMSTRWDEMNCHPQSMEQNVFEHGNILVYREKMIKRYGLEAVEKLEQKARIVVAHYSENDLKEMIQYYTARLAQVKAEKHLLF